MVRRVGAYLLHVRDRSDRMAAWELKWYRDSAYPCEVRFLEWYGNAVLVIYREKHQTYTCRFGLDSPAQHKVIGSRYDLWVVDGRRLGYRRYQETSVRRLAIPSLEELPPVGGGSSRMGANPVKRVVARAPIQQQAIQANQNPHQTPLPLPI
jgi:hypothetical protein